MEYNMKEFLIKYNVKYSNSDINSTENEIRQFYEHLDYFNKKYQHLNETVTKTLNTLDTLTEQFNYFYEKTTSLDQSSRKLIAEQYQLSCINENMLEKLNYFNIFNSISNQLMGQSYVINYVDVINKLQEFIQFLNQHTDYKEYEQYMVKYKILMFITISSIKAHINLILSNSMDSILDDIETQNAKDLPSNEINEKYDYNTVSSIYYGKFVMKVNKIIPIVKSLEEKVDSVPEYVQLLDDIQSFYTEIRYKLLNRSIQASVKLIGDNHINTDKCLYVRTICSLFMTLCQDEYKLFYSIFTLKSHATTSTFLRSYLTRLCSHFYETLRPFVNNIEHIEILCELCLILSKEMVHIVNQTSTNIPTNVLNNDILTKTTNSQQMQRYNDALVPIGESIIDLLKDIQERLEYRCHIYFRTNILEYNPAPGDLCYPEKLHVIDDIINSSINIMVPPSRSTSIVSVEDKPEKHPAKLIRQTSTSDINLIGMWYPTLRRTIKSLSQLYRCLRNEIFQNLAQEAVHYCLLSLINARKLIAERNNNLVDGYLFEIKHLLILREHIASFCSDDTNHPQNSTMDEVLNEQTSTAVSTVRYKSFVELILTEYVFETSKLLKYLLNVPIESSKEHKMGAKKLTDLQLKYSCGLFIEHVTHLICATLISYNEKMHYLVKKKQQGDISEKTINDLRMRPEDISAMIHDCKRLIKTKLAECLRMMDLYIRDKEIVSILFRPIKNNIVNAFVQLEQQTESLFNKDEISILAFPITQHISVMLSSIFIANSSYKPAEEEQKPSV